MQSEELIERVLAFVPAIYLMGECLYSYTKSRVRALSRVRQFVSGICLN